MDYIININILKIYFLLYFWILHIFHFIEIYTLYIYEYIIDKQYIIDILILLN